MGHLNFPLSAEAIKRGMKASVVIPTYNRLPVLKEYLHSILHCNGREYLLEIISVDNSSRDGTIDFLKECVRRGQKIVYSSIPESDAIRARNLGFSLARGDVVWGGGSPRMSGSTNTSGIASTSM